MNAPASGKVVFSTRTANAALLVLGAAMLVLVVWGRYLINQEEVYKFAGWSCALAVPFFLASWVVWRARAARSTLWIVLGMAALLRIGPLTSDVYLSTDPYRYVWDGRVQAHGINPYRYVPADPHLATLRDGAIYPHINRKEYARTIYPPAAQWSFYALTRFGESVETVRVAMVLWEAVAVACLVALLRLHGLPEQRVLLYAWAPVCVWEFAGGAHCDAVMIALLALTFLLHRLNRPFATGTALGLAVMTKLFPIVLLPVLWRRWRWDWRMPAALAATIVAGYLPYVLTFSLRGALGFLPGYASEEGLETGSRFYFLSLFPSGWLNALGLPPYRVFSALVVLIFAVAATWAYWKRPTDEFSDLRRAACLAALVLGTLSPALDWYFAWLALFLPFLGEWWLAWMPSVAFVLYFNWEYTKPEEIFLQNSVIFLPALLFWAVPAALRWRRRFAGGGPSVAPAG